MITINLEFLNIDIDILQIESEYNTFEAKLCCILHHHSSHRQIIFDSLWFENSQWDEFVNDLEKSEHNMPAILTDISGKISLMVTFDINLITLSIKSNEKFSRGSMTYDNTLIIEEDELSVIKAGFRQLDKWW